MSTKFVTAPEAVLWDPAGLTGSVSAVLGEQVRDDGFVYPGMTALWINLKAGQTYSFFGDTYPFPASPRIDLYDGNRNKLSYEIDASHSTTVATFTPTVSGLHFLTIYDNEVYPGLYSVFVSATGAKSVFLGDGADTYTGKAGERIVGGRGNDTLSLGAAKEALGGIGDDRIVGNDADNRISGGIGDDEIVLGKGQNVVWGDAGQDLIRSGKGNDRIYGGDGYDALIGGEGVNRLSGGADGDVLYGYGGNDVLAGDDGNDRLFGGDGEDALSGGAGADYLAGGAGNDTYYVSDDKDTIKEGTLQGTDRIVASISFDLGTNSNIEIVELQQSGKKQAVSASGSDNANILYGNSANNVLNGKGGADKMYGRFGDDAYAVDQAGDLVFEAKGQGKDVVATIVSYVLQSGQEIEVLRIADPNGKQGLSLTGNEFGNQLIGNDGSNLLDAREGADLLTGRGGVDAFLFSTKLGAGNVDRITDFVHGTDTIRLDDAVFSALKVGALATSAFKTLGFAKVDADDRILYDSLTGNLFYDADGSGSASAQLFAVLKPQPVTLNAADFLVV